MDKLGKRHLIIDGQIFQSAARHRGMGRYSEYLLTALTAEREYNKITIILAKDSHAPEVDPEDLENLFKGSETVFLDLKGATNNTTNGSELHNKKIINNYIKKQLNQKRVIDFLILGAFQEPTVSVFPEGVNKYLIFYDLIPYLYYDKYSTEMPFDKYLDHFKLLFEADKLLCISESVRDDLIVYLGIPLEKTGVIHGAAIRSERDPTPPSFTIPKKFILLPTGDDFRKNNHRTVLGFEKFNTESGGEYKLLITSNIHPSEKAKLKKVSRNLIFTGNVHETVMDWLYDKADVVLFAPETEGLGLPILEAVRSNKPVVCSSIEVFKEISKKAFYYCEYLEPDTIAAALNKAIHGLSTPTSTKEYDRILSFYSWEETARRAIDSMANTKTKRMIDKPKIAMFIPKPDGISAIGKVVAETHATLINYFDVDYYSESGAPVSMRPNYLKHVAHYLPATQFAVESYKKYQAVFYHIGNSEYHLESIANSLYLPGYVILHDTNIGGAYGVMLERDIISRQRFSIEEDITRTGNFKLSNNIASVVTNQQGIITHSEYAADAVHEINQNLYVKKTNLPTSVPTRTPDRSYDNLRLGLAGIIADIKGIEVIERLIKDNRYQRHNFSLFGINYSNGSVLNRLRSYGNVEVATNVTDFDFVRKMKQLDIFVNYRMKYQGETSLSTLEAMRQGVVVVVRNVGWYAELPDEAVVKVDSIEEAVEKLDYLIGRPDKLREISENAVSYIRRSHSHNKYVEAMIEIVNNSSKASNPIARTVRALKKGDVKSKADLQKIREIL